MELISAPAERSIIVSPTWNVDVAMPVTAKLSKKLYDKLGHDVVDELVEWLNQVDAAYRSEFRDLFEAHFARFETKLEQRTGELRAEIAGAKADTIRWNFLFWIGTLGTVIALVKLG
jgi:hypothetical protein